MKILFFAIAPIIAAFIGFKFGKWASEHDNIFEQEINQLKNNQ